MSLELYLFSWVRTDINALKKKLPMCIWLWLNIWFQCVSSCIFVLDWFLSYCAALRLVLFYRIRYIWTDLKMLGLFLCRTTWIVIKFLVFFNLLVWLLKRGLTSVRLKYWTDSAMGLIVDSHEPPNTINVFLISLTSSKKDLVP
jgi:hypothetical protein